jgi:hypothetical protein
MKYFVIATNRTLMRILLLSCICLISYSHLVASTYYVSASGNDANSGLSTTAAWKTINKVNSVNIKPGDKILFEGGRTFIGNLYLDYNDANDSINVVVISSYGTGRAIINASTAYGIYAYNTQGLTISNLIFQGSGMDTNTSDGISIYMDLKGDVKLKNIVIANVGVSDFGKNGITIGSWNRNSGFKNVTIDGADVYNIKQNGITTWGYTAQTLIGWAHKNITIKNSRIHDIPGYASTSHKGSGIIMGQVDQGLIERCVAYHNGTANTHCGGPGGIWVWDSNNIIIQHCESYQNSKGTGCDGFGFDLDGGVTNSTMQFNYAHNNEGAGFSLGQYSNARPWFNNTVRYNISENDARNNTGAIYIFKGSGTTMEGVNIYQNTIYLTPSVLNTAASGFAIKRWNTGINGVQVFNNIFQTTGGVPLISIPLDYNAYFAGNIYWTSGSSFKIKYQGVTYGNLTNWRTATGNEKLGDTPTGLAANPLLTNVGNGGTISPLATEMLSAYKLQSTSPAINRGLNLATSFSINSVAKDYFNNNILSESVVDVGAYESNTTVSARGDEEMQDVSDGELHETVNMFPNPVRGDSAVKLTVSSNHSVIYTIELFSTTGMLLWKSKSDVIDSIAIPTRNLESGIYMVRIVDDAGKTITNKLVVE